LTNPAKQNIITSIRGSKRQMADIKSEPRPASNRNRWPASYWNAWPGSSESAAERGIDISHETVRFWWNRFGPMFATEIRKKRLAHLRRFPQWR
jgi:hypothetical protein